MILRFKVTPNAIETHLIRWDGTYAHLRLKALATENKANKALLEFCKLFFQLPASSVVLIRGQKSRIKHVELPLPEAFVHNKLMLAANQLPPASKDDNE